MNLSPRAAKYLSGAFAAIAIGLIIVHFSLDHGPHQEAPRWILYTGIAAAFLGTFVGLQGERTERE